MVEALLKAYPDAAKAKDGCGMLPLHRAAAYKVCTVGVVEALLKAYPDAAKAKDKDDMLPLHHAAYKAEVGVVEALLKAYPDAAKAKDEYGMLPLHRAAMYTAEVGVVEALLKAYPDAAKAKDVCGMLPLHSAARYKAEVGVVEALLKAYPDAAKAKDKYGILPLHHAAKDKAEVGVVEALLKAYPDAAKAKDGSAECGIHYIIQDDKYQDVVRVVLETRKGDAQTLANLADSKGRKAIDIAAPACKRVMEEYFLFCGKYRFSRSVPQYASATCEVWFATDLSSDEKKQVCIKIMKNKDEYTREIESRKGLSPPGVPTHVVEVDEQESQRITAAFADNVAKLPEQSSFRAECELMSLLQKLEVDFADLSKMMDVGEASGLDQLRLNLFNLIKTTFERMDVNKDGKLSREEISKYVKEGNSAFCLVMECGECNFGEMLKNRKLAGDRLRLMEPLQDIAKFLAHLHEKGLVHCDVKPQNVVRMASGEIKGIDLDGSASVESKDLSSKLFGTKISSAFLPPECIACHVEAVEQHRYVIRSANDKRNAIEAQRTMDIWQSGTLLYRAMTGKDLFQADDHDNLADESDLEKIHTWTESIKDQKLIKVKDLEARKLLHKILCKEPEHRPQSFEAILEDDFFQVDGSKKGIIKRLEAIEQGQARVEKGIQHLAKETLKLQHLAKETLAQVKRSEEVLRKAVFESTEIHTPTCFIILPRKLGDHGEADARENDEMCEEMQKHLLGFAGAELTNAEDDGGGEREEEGGDESES